MKTFAEVLAGNNTAEINAMLLAHTKRIGEIDKVAKGRETKSATEDELTEWTQLDDECEQLQVKALELKAHGDREKRQVARAKAMTTPVGGVPHPTGDGGQGDTKPAITFPGVGSLKHIKIGTRQENEEVAYKFFQWFCATGLRPDSQMKAKAQEYCDSNGIATKTLNEGTNEQGGALVPPEFDPMLIRLVETYGVFRQYAKVSPMASETKSQPRRTGGITTYWVGEGATITASNPTFDNINLVAKKLAAITVMSSEISEDSAINIADELAFEMGYGFALAEDQAGFIGDASSTYGGITGVTTKLKALHATIAYIAGLYVGSGNAYSELALVDFNNVVGLLPQYADPNAAWYAHKSFFHTVMQRLELATGGVTAKEISDGDRRGRPMFLGYPVNFCQVMPRTEANSQVCALFGDLAMGATFGDRRRRTVFTDPYSLSNKDQILVRSTERIDINVHDVGNANATASLRVAGPIVGLITAAS